MPMSTLGKTFFWIGQSLEVVGIVWAMLGLREEWRQLSASLARFKTPFGQILAQPETFEKAPTFPTGNIDPLDVWPSEPDHQIAWLKNRIEAVRTQIDGQFAGAAKNVAEAEARMNRKVNDVANELSVLANDLSQYKTSNWVQRLGGPFVAALGVLLTIAGSLIG